jgi:tetratricopeptide (TPR) repeat protein
MKFLLPLAILTILIACNQDTKTITDKGIELFEQDKYSEAIVQFDKAISKNSNDTTAYYYRGQSYLLQEKYGKAKLDFDKVIDMDKTAYNSRLSRGVCFISSKNWDSAIKDITYFIDSNATSAGAYLWRGQSYINLGQVEKGLQDLFKSIELDSTNAEPYFSLGQVKLQQGLKEEGKIYMTKASDLGFEDAKKYLAENFAKYFQLRLVSVKGYGSFAELNFELKNLITHVDKFWLTATLRDKSGEYLAGEENIMWDNIRPNGISIDEAYWDNIKIKDIGEVILTPDVIEIKGVKIPDFNTNSVEILPNKFGIKVSF